MKHRKMRFLWETLLCNLNVTGNSNITFRELVQTYEEPHRHYHTLAHIKACLEELDEVESVGRRVPQVHVVELALWFHDFYYDTSRADNEERSAVRARAFCMDAGLERICPAVERAILATKHAGGEEVDETTAYVVDIDLSILGQPKEVFDGYETQIRAEYAWVPEHIFREKRAEILEGMLAHGPIYRTPFFNARYEAQARVNLERSIQALRA